MPPPNRRHDPSPEELARQVAAQLARSQPTTPRFSLRNSVLVGRLITGVVALASIVLVVAGVVAGVDWMLARTMEPDPEVLANTFELDDPGGEAVAADPTTTTADGTLLPLVSLMFPTPLPDTVSSVDQPGPTAVTIPPTTTTSTTSVPGTGGGTSSTTVTTTPPATTTPPPTTTTLPATTTTAPMTTTTEPTTTTTTATSTTTTATSTTTEATTTTTTRPSPPSTPGQGR